MNDFDWDVLQKKRIANNKYKNVRYRQCGCHLPHEDLTAAELKRRNGPMATYRLNEPMTYKEFKQMPADLRQNYIDLIQKRWNVGQKEIAEHLFHITQTSISHSFKVLGVRTKIVRGARLEEQFKTWCSGEVSTEEPVKEEKTEAPVSDDLDAKYPYGAEKVEFTITAGSALSAMMSVPKMMSGALAVDKPVRVTVSLEVMR